MVFRGLFMRYSYPVVYHNSLYVIIINDIIS